MKPITYKEFEEKINALGADINHRADAVEVDFEGYTVGEVSKHEKFQIEASFGYVEEFEKVEMSKILKLMVRLSATELSDRMPRYKFKLPNCHIAYDVFSWLNVHRSTNKISLSSEDENRVWQTTFTEEDIESLPEEVRILVRSLEAHLVS